MFSNCIKNSYKVPAFLNRKVVYGSENGTTSPVLEQGIFEIHFRTSHYHVIFLVQLLVCRSIQHNIFKGMCRKRTTQYCSRIIMPNPEWV